MFGMGMREWVALGVLGIAGVLGFLFFDPTSTEGGTHLPPTISLGELAATRTPAAPAETTPTPIPVAKLNAPGGQWRVEYYELTAAGNEIRSGEGFLDRLALDAPGRPFPDFRDDAWKLAASQRMNLGAGRYSFSLESDGALRVSAGDTIILDVADASERKVHGLQFDHAGGAISLTIELKDTGGPAFLRWIE